VGRCELDLSGLGQEALAEPCEHGNEPCGSIKVNVKLSLCFFLTKHHTMKEYCGVEEDLHAFLTSTLNGGEWSASRPGCFTPRERAPGTHWIGGWVGPRTCMDVVAKRKIPSLCRDSNPKSYSHSPLLN
jgi:hypothetical protein